VAILASLLAIAMNEQTLKDDPLLSHFIGKWHITRVFAKRHAENTANVEWVLDGHWLRISMKDTAKPSKYEAHVYITYVVAEKKYSVHWLDTFGGTLPESLGLGIRDGNSIVCSWKDSDGELRNTFTWYPDNHTWTSKIEQTGKDGKWTTYCTDTYRRA
jgi:hypothetical protein